MEDEAETPLQTPRRLTARSLRRRRSQGARAAFSGGARRRRPPPRGRRRRARAGARTVLASTTSSFSMTPGVGIGAVEPARLHAAAQKKPGLEEERLQGRPQDRRAAHGAL